jgi:hypothetical protein
MISGGAAMNDMCLETSTAHDGVMAAYRSIRTACDDVWDAAEARLTRAEMVRAAKLLRVWTEYGACFEKEERATVVTSGTDLALFEPNQLGRRSFDRFMATHAGGLDPTQRAVARQMAKAYFSIFRYVEPHEVTGVWLEDLLAHGRRVWVADRDLEEFAAGCPTFGLRLFDAGPFHIGLCVVPVTDEETIDLCVKARAGGRATPFRHSIAATLYGREVTPAFTNEYVEQTVQKMLGRMAKARESAPDEFLPSAAACWTDAEPSPVVLDEPVVVDHEL